jgi:hypothetical protein
MDTEAQALAVIAQELRQIKEALAPTKQVLGFGAAPKNQVYVFCNRKNGGLWYTLSEQNQPVIIEQPALIGYVRKLEFKQTTRRGKESHKLHCYVEADKNYILESGHDSLFSKGLLSALAAAYPLDLREPVTIEVQPADNESVLFCNVYINGKRVISSFDDQTDWKLTSRAAIDGVKAANGEAVAMPGVTAA